MALVTVLDTHGEKQGRPQAAGYLAYIEIAHQVAEEVFFFTEVEGEQRFSRRR
jgi:hypothetical protein